MKRTMHSFLYLLGLLLAACGGDGNTSDAESSAEDGNDSASQTPVDTDMTSYEGFHDVYILTLADDPTDVCRIRYQAKAVGEPDVPCDFCEWDVVVEFTDPQVIEDLNGACANSDLGLDEATIEIDDGRRVVYGFAREHMGHANNLMRLNEDSGQWEPVAVSNYDPEAASFTYDRRSGVCSYQSDDDPGTNISGICGVSGEATVSD